MPEKESLKHYYPFLLAFIFNCILLLIISNPQIKHSNTNYINLTTIDCSGMDVGFMGKLCESADLNRTRTCFHTTCIHYTYPHRAINTWINKQLFNFKLHAKFPRFN